MAEEFLEHVLEIAPDTAAAYADKASISILRDGDVGPARALLDDPPIDLGERRQGLGWYTAIYEREYMAALSYLDEWELGLFDPLSESHVTPTRSYYGVTYQLLGQPNQALTHFQAAREVLEAALNTSPDNPRLHIGLGEVLAGLEEREAAVESARRAIELMPMSVDVIRGSYVLFEAILRVFIPAGDHEAALDELDAYLGGPGSWSIEGLLPDPRLDPIRDDPRFQALVEKYRRQ